MTEINETNLPAKATLQQMIMSKQNQYQTLLPRHISPERFMRIIFTQMQKNKALADCTQESVLSAVLVAAELGLIPDGRKGALVPFNNKGVKEAVFIPMYQGLIDLARQSGQIADIFPATVCENDDFDYELGLSRGLYHRPAFKNRGPAIAFYAVVEFKDGTKTFGTGPMMLEDMQDVRKRSKAAQAGPWVTDFEAMAWKTMIKRVLKFCPQSPELESALILEGNYEKDFDASMIDVGDTAGEQKNINIANQAINIQAKATERLKRTQAESNTAMEQKV